LKLAAHFRANPKFKAVPIVFLTAIVTKKEAAVAGWPVGGEPVLAKPVVLAELDACIRHQLGE
jgi:DNA-binding response OmpR family regulator